MPSKPARSTAPTCSRKSFMRLPCQAVRTSRRIVFRLLAWIPWVHVLLRGVDVLRQPLRC